LDKYLANQEFVFNFDSELMGLEVYQFACNGTRVWYVDAGIEDTPEPGGAFLKMEVGICKGAWQRA